MGLSANSTNDAIKILDKAIQSIIKGKSFFNY